jgi:hypothetical protein
MLCTTHTTRISSQISGAHLTNQQMVSSAAHLFELNAETHDQRFINWNVVWQTIYLTEHQFLNRRVKAMPQVAVPWVTYLSCQFDWIQLIHVTPRSAVSCSVHVTCSPLKTSEAPRFPMDWHKLLESPSNPEDSPANVRHILFISWQRDHGKILFIKILFYH